MARGRPEGYYKKKIDDAFAQGKLAERIEIINVWRMTLGEEKCVEDALTQFDAHLGRLKSQLKEAKK
jgi:hypothetical protein